MAKRLRTGGAAGAGPWIVPKKAEETDVAEFSEGTWTVTLRHDTTEVNLDTDAAGRWKRYGDLLWFNISARFTGDITGGTTDVLRFTDLPFTLQTIDGLQSTAVGRWAGFIFPATVVGMQVTPDPPNAWFEVNWLRDEFDVVAVRAQDTRAVGGKSIIVNGWVPVV